jgi:hypothetical protein
MTYDQYDPFARLPKWSDLLRISEAELSSLDIAVVNLACAAGLPGSHKIDVELCLETIEDWTEYVRRYTAKAMPRFFREPWEFEYSEGRFRILAMITALQRDLGVKYDVSKIPLDVPLGIEGSFIHGIIQGDGGTCASLPTLYASVGRRLGYPIKLVSAQAKGAGHLFARWDVTVHPNCSRGAASPAR